MKKTRFTVEGFAWDTKSDSKRGVAIKVSEDIEPREYLAQYGAALIALYNHEVDRVNHVMKVLDEDKPLAERRPNHVKWLQLDDLEVAMSKMPSGTVIGPGGPLNKYYE